MCVNSDTVGPVLLWNGTYIPLLFFFFYPLHLLPTLSWFEIMKKKKNRGIKKKDTVGSPAREMCSIIGKGSSIWHNNVLVASGDILNWYIKMSKEICLGCCRLSVMSSLLWIRCQTERTNHTMVLTFSILFFKGQAISVYLPLCAT